MASLQTQVRALAGTSTNELQWVNDGIRVVIDRLLSIDPESGHLFSQELSGSSSGATVTERQHILSVAKGSKAATEIPPDKRFAAAEATSLQKATADYPQYYVLDQKLYILPSGNFTYSAVDYTTLVNLSASTISNFPTSLIPIVVNYAAMKALQERMVGYTGLSGLVLSLPSTPPQPTLSFGVANDGMTAVTAVGDVSLPEYVSIADPSIDALDLSSSNSAIDAIPTPPGAPSFIYTDAALQGSYGAQSATFSTAAPTYTPPVMKEINFTKITSLIETDEDIELAQSKLSEEQQKVTEFSAKIQDSLNTFNKENAEYQVQFQKSINEFEKDIQRRIQEMSLSTNVDLQNKAKGLEKEASEYNSQLQRYGTQVQQYQAQLNAVVQEWTLENLNYKFAKWQADLQENLNEYQAKVGSTIQKYSADISRQTSLTQAEAAELGAKLQHDAAKNQVELQRFGSQLQDYQARAQTYIAEFNAKMQKEQIQYQWYEKQYAMVREQFEKGFEPFMIRRQQDGEQSRVRS
mgnify:FL=1|tara:strand:- start:6341 stop:7906 length:1566 start_codon:yes stop_codon:yes gene_type:complete